MNVLFLTIGSIDDIESKGLYPDLLRCFRDHNHSVYIISTNERRYGKKTQYTEQNNTHILHLRVGNLTKCGIIEKGISTLLIESQYKYAIRKFFHDVKFDIVLYSTPPITLLNAIKFVKKRDNAFSYLLLKDIFPQNAVDLGILTHKGIKGVLWRYFRHKEKGLYEISDTIGCMSRANVDYILRNNTEIRPEKAEICPNSIEVTDKSVDAETKKKIRVKYQIPVDKTVFVYGGNLGKPQGIDFLIECLKGQKENRDVFFLIIGDGTEYAKLETFMKNELQENVKLMRSLPKEDYDTLVGACDVGMIFLDHRFTIPNFPSRILSYMQAKIPVLACTDANTDIGSVITDGNFGWWCESNNVENFNEKIKVITSENLDALGNNAKSYLENNYSSDKAYKIILNAYNVKTPRHQKNPCFSEQAD